MLRLVPIHLAEANEFVRLHHRHSQPVIGARLCVAVADDERVPGVAIAGRPVARRLQDGWTLEVNRVATDGARNACSMLYAACWRAARAIGYTRLVTYTLESEGGASLRAAGFRLANERGARPGWDTPARGRADDDYLSSTRLRWELGAPEDAAPPGRADARGAAPGGAVLVREPEWSVEVGDCRDLLRAMPAESVQCAVTSPPYFGLRDYGLPPTVRGGRS